MLMVFVIITLRVAEIIQVFDKRGNVVKKRVGILLLTFIVGCVPFLNASAAYAASTVTATIPMSATDVTNPQRGQYENLMTGLFPQANPAQSAYPAWPSTSDTGSRYEWRQLQPVDPSTLPLGATDAQKYDFSAIDNDIAAAAAQGKRFHFRVTSFNSCCAVSYPNNTDISVPDWLRGLNGATNDYANGGVTYVIPDWNNNTYLTHMEDLLAALGRRYNHDEWVEWIEMSGYGDFSENHVAFMRDTLGMPAPDGPSSVAQLGYYSQYEDQYITKASIIRLVDAMLQAFPDTQIVTAAGNAEIVKQLMRDSSVLPSVKKTVGVRGDCLGVYEPAGTWAIGQWSHYVQNNDPIIPILINRWKTAPVVTEWCNWVPATEQAYFEKGITDAVNYHVSEIASTGHPYQFSGTQMPAPLYGLWNRTVKYSGYRYAMTHSVVPDTVAYGSNVPISVQWTNFGVAPTYNNWQVRYDIRDANGSVVKTTNSTLNLKSLYAEQNYTDISASPASQSTTDTAALSTAGLAAGNYTVFARAVWNEHKVGGTNTVTYADMNFAQGGRDNGAYPVGAFTLAAVSADAGASGNVSSSPSLVPGAPNTGAARVASNVWVYGLTAVGILLAIGTTLLGFRRLRRTK